jgi:hypothetical protein
MTALKALRLAPDTYLDHLGMYLDSATTVAGLKFDFNQHFEDNWVNMNHLTILSFHNSAGAVMPDAAIPVDPVVLKPVQDGPVSNCCPGDVRFVRVQLILDFCELCTAAAPTDNTILRTDYYIELPQDTVIVRNAANVPRNLTTFQGPADLCTLSVEQMYNQVINDVPQDGPIGLLEAPILANPKHVSVQSGGQRFSCLGFGGQAQSFSSAQFWHHTHILSRTLFSYCIQSSCIEAEGVKNQGLVRRTRLG